MRTFTPDRFYFICTVQRTGSQLFCTLLQDTGVAGLPPAHELCRACWKEEWTAEAFSDDLDCILKQATGKNGIASARMFWNAWEPFLERSRAARSERDTDDFEVLTAVFSELQFVWLRRLDKLRQAISFWRATTGGDQFRYPTDGTPVNIPDFDFERISRFVQIVTEQENNWKNWFDSYRIMPKQVAYEDLILNRGSVIREVLEFLKIKNSKNVMIPEPRVIQQADEHTERYVHLYIEESERRRTREGK